MCAIHEALCFEGGCDDKAAIFLAALPHKKHTVSILQANEDL